MKKIKLLLLTLALVFVVSGCLVQPIRYNYDVPRKIYFTEVKENENPKDTFYNPDSDGILYIPKGSKWITKEDLKWQIVDPKDGDIANIRKTALILHEASHFIDMQNWYKYIPGEIFFPKLEMKRAEFTAYSVQLRYLKKRGIKFDDKEIQIWVNYLIDPRYKKMCTKEEARAFILAIVRD